MCHHFGLLLYQLMQAALERQTTWIWSLWIWSQSYPGAYGMWSSHCPGHTPASHKSFLCLHTAANCSAQSEGCCFSGQVAVNSHMGACSGRPGITVCPVSYPYQLQPACGRGQHPNSCITTNSFPSSYSNWGVICCLLSFINQLWGL